MSSARGLRAPTFMSIFVNIYLLMNESILRPKFKQIHKVCLLTSLT